MTLNTVSNKYCEEEMANWPIYKTVGYHYNLYLILTESISWP